MNFKGKSEILFSLFTWKHLLPFIWETIQLLGSIVSTDA